MRNPFIAGALLATLATSALAEAVPGRGKYDTRVRETRYVDGQVFLVRTSLKRSTTVEFEPGERIVSIVAGDTSGFNFESIPGDRVFAIKPTARGVQTNATIYTDRRSYYLSLKEGNAPFYVLRFKYPRRATATNASSNAIKRSARNPNYGVSAKNAVTPVSVWDDGAFTYFRFRRNAPVPSIFKVSGGFERSVNSQVIKDRIVRVSGTSKQWALRLGDTEVCIVELFK